jgi:hypothetical protein
LERTEGQRRALDRENAPIGRAGRVGIIEHLERLFVIADVGKRAAVGSEHAAMLGVLDRRLLEHGDGLRALAVGAQRLGIIDRRFGIVRISAVAHGPHLRRARPIRFPADGAGPTVVSVDCVVLQPMRVKASAAASANGANCRTKAEQIEQIITPLSGPATRARQ